MTCVSADKYLELQILQVLSYGVSESDTKQGAGYYTDSC